MARTENKLELGQPFIMKPPTTSDPLWWFVYKHKGFIIELGTNTDKPVYTLKEANQEDFYHTGYFKIKKNERKGQASV